MAKIVMKSPLVEMDGDEMTRVIWEWLKETLIEPYVELKTEYYDLGLKNRDETEDKVTVEAALARRCRQMRHHYTQCGQEGIQPQKM